MICIENVEVTGFSPAIRGMRNPMNSWERSDSPAPAEGDGAFQPGPNDAALMRKLAEAGPVHAKYRRMIVVYADITAPLYWWKEFDTYKVGTVANSCSTMHKLHARPFSAEDFSREHLAAASMEVLETVVAALNRWRERFLETRDKDDWWQMIQLLPSSYNQRRTVMLNYEVLAGIYPSRRDHKLDEWREFCRWIEALPVSEIITGGSLTESTTQA